MSGLINTLHELAFTLGRFRSDDEVDEALNNAAERIAALEAENASLVEEMEKLRQSIKAAWLLGRKAWCPAAILDDQDRTERDWQQALAALEDKP